MNNIQIIHECPSCDGTGLYQGVAEGEGEEVAIVCNQCKGKGYQESVFKPFMGRKKQVGITRVFECNPGIGVAASEEFGGISYTDWMNGFPFPKGSEMREYVCPRWSTGSFMPDWEKCHENWGKIFLACPHFPTKNECWEQWDKESGK